MSEEGKTDLTVLASLLAVQRDLKAPKNQYNTFGKYKYRSCEDILEAAKPLCNENGLILTLQDTVEQVGNRYYIIATARVMDIVTGDSYQSLAYAREEETKKGMDGAQVTGAASSYARKYALCGLFAIDDTKDADAEPAPANKEPAPANKEPAPANKEPAPANKEPNAKDILNEAWGIAKRQNVSSGEMQKILEVKYKVKNSQQVTIDQALDLKENLLEYVQEMREAG